MKAKISEQPSRCAHSVIYPSWADGKVPVNPYCSLCQSAIVIVEPTRKHKKLKVDPDEDFTVTAVDQAEDEENSDAQEESELDEEVESSEEEQ